MRHKSEVFGHFQKFKSKVGKTTGRHVRCLRSGGKEYFLDYFTTYLRKEGIQREFPCRHTPQQNGVAERKKSEYPRSSTGHDEREAYAQVTLGRSCEYVCLPYEPVHNIRNGRGHATRKILRKEAGFIAHPDIQRDRIHAHTQREVQKLDPKSEKCILIGYSLEQKGYKCYNPSTRKVRVSRDADTLRNRT